MGKKVVNKKKNISRQFKRRKRLKGRVVSNKMDKTVVVSVIRKSSDPMYKKIMTSRKQYKAHCEKAIEVGDIVLIQQTRPISKQKHWRVIEVIKKTKK
jgi:small subunit ribosomal protein S17